MGVIPGTATHDDARLAAFLARDGAEVFHAIEHTHEIWRDDPFDVATVHDEAREVFQRLFVRATTPPGVSSGRLLLLLGESGCGKTHLMRAFRNQVHESGRGFVGYLHMTSGNPDYGRYILHNLIDSLQKPYFQLNNENTGLMRLSGVLAARARDHGHRLGGGHEDEAPMGSSGFDELHELVRQAADAIVLDPRYADVEIDLLRALLYLQSRDPRIQHRVLKYLRCEDISAADRAYLGGIVPRSAEGDPQRQVEGIGRLLWALDCLSLVILIDQFEDSFDPSDPTHRNFNGAMTAVCALADRVPSSIVVVSCLDTYYDTMRGSLRQSIRDRLERDPDFIKLKSPRTPEEVRAIVGRRLAFLYQESGAQIDEADPTFPVPPALLAEVKAHRTRDILDRCREYREQSIALGRLAGWPPGMTAPPTILKAPGAPPPSELGQLWNDHRSSFHKPRPEEDEEIAALLAWALAVCSTEITSGHRITARVAGDAVEVDIAANGTATLRLFVALCNREPRAGKLAKQIESVRKRAGQRVPVLVRATEYPSDPRSAVGKQIAAVIDAGGRRTNIEDADLLRLLALREFREQHRTRPDYASWLQGERPLTQLRVIQDILRLDELKAAPPTTASPTTPSPTTPSLATQPSLATTATATTAQTPPGIAAAYSSGPIQVGATPGIRAQPVAIEPRELTQHAAFLGGPGSGKTTLALSLIEQALLRGIPAILIDRKGDLCNYLADAAWSEPLGDPELDEQRRQLRERLDIALFTPGHPEGRPLAIGLVPEGLGGLADFVRDEEAAYAAHAIGGMLDYRHMGKDNSCRAILIQAVRLLGQLDAPVHLDRLIDFIAQPDPALVAATGRLDTKLFDKLVQDLETLNKITGQKLLDPRGERLDLDLLLGRGGSRPGARTRLSIVSTKFIGDNAAIQFWVAQLLLQAARWSSRHPSQALQALLFFDEADLYLPAMSQPATKGPMENLLKRARSAGLGILLATQNPGDFDYKCRDAIKSWFVGRVTQNTALAKLKPMLAEARVDVASKLPGQKMGEFFLVKEGEATPLLARRSSIETRQLPESEILALATRR